MVNEIRRENIAITSAFLISGTHALSYPTTGIFIYTMVVLVFTETGFCDSEVDETDWGTYQWPETLGGSQATLPCVEDTSITVTRECLTGGGWDTPAYGGCALLGLTVK